MKVAFLGNVNNHPFIVCKHLREKGVDTIFFVEASKENMLYRPEATGFVEYPYPDWIIEVPQFQQSKVIHLPQLYARDVIKRINTCDAVILNDFGHRLMPFLRKGMIKISMFTGGDLDIMADFGIVEYMKLKSAKLQFIPAFIRKIFARQTVHQLRKAIAGADLVAYYPEGLHKAGDQILKEIFGNKPYKKYSHWCLMLDGIVYKPPPPHTAGKKIKVLNLARFMWKEPFPAGRSPLENKRNDIMIRGIGNFLKSHPGSLDIHFVDKGIDVKESKALIEEYGYSNDVTWHDNMPLKDIIIEIEKADIVFDQLGNHLFGA
ncbi:MAG: hypothetical protein ABIT96_04530, partial [Ferruginibacter sp.]